MQEINGLEYQETYLERLNSHVDLSVDNMWFSIDATENKLIAALLASVLLIVYALTTRTSSFLSAILLSVLITSVVFSCIGLLYPRPKIASAHRRIYFEDFSEDSVDDLNEHVLKINLKLSENLEVCLENKTINLWFSLICICLSVFLSCFI